MNIILWLSRIVGVTAATSRSKANGKQSGDEHHAFFDVSQWFAPVALEPIRIPSHRPLERESMSRDLQKTPYGDSGFY